MKETVFFVVAAATLATASLRAGDYASMRIMSFNICHCATHYSLSIGDDDVRGRFERHLARVRSFRDPATARACTEIAPRK